MAERKTNLQHLALQLLTNLLKSCSYGDELSEPLNELAALLQALPPKALFSDWSPAPRAEEPLAVNGKEAFADAHHSAAQAASAAVDATAGAFWASGSGAALPHTWGIRLAPQATDDEAPEDGEEDGKPITLSSMLVETHERHPLAAFHVEVTTDGSSWTRVAAVKKEAAFHRIELAGCRATQARIVVTKLGEDNADGTVALRNVSFSRPCPLTDTRALLSDIQRWLAGAVPTPALTVRSLAGLQGLSLASGSLAAMLQLTHVLLQLREALPEAAASDAGDFLVAFKAALHEEKKAAIATVVQASHSGGGGSALAAAAAHATFDESCKHAGIVLEDGAKLARSGDSSKKHVYVNIGFTSGKAAWEFQVEKDKNGDECSCFGAGTKPVTSSAYDSSPQMWLLRAYNGRLYNRGSSGSSISKVHPNDIVRCELDMDEGTLKYFVNGVDQGVAFTGLTGEVFPALAFYGSDRAVRLLKVEVLSGGGGGGGGGGIPSEELFLSDLSPDASSVGYGDFGSGGKLGWDDRLIEVAGESKEYGLSTHPPASGAAYATYQLGGVYGRLSGGVALADSADEEELGSAINFQLLGDGRQLWASEPVTKPRDVQFFDVSLLSVHELKLVARVSGSNDNAHAVWVDPKLLPAGSEPWCCPRCSYLNLPTAAECDMCALSAEEAALESEESKGAEDAAAADAAAAAEGKPAAFASSLLTELAELASVHMRALAATPPPTFMGRDISWDRPFAVELSAASFTLMDSLLAQLLDRCDGAGDGESDARAMAVAVMNLVKTNACHLLAADVDPAALGIITGAESARLAALAEGKEEDASRESKESDDTSGTAAGDAPQPTLAPLSKTLQRAVDGSFHDELQLAAASTLELCRGLLTASDDGASELAASLGNGGTVEVQFAFPARDSEGEEDGRFERALLLLQVECSLLGFRTQLSGRWRRNVFLMIGLSNDASTADFLQGAFAECLRRAGFDDFRLPAGCSSPSIPLKLERFVGFNRRERALFETDVGYVRVYPKSVAPFEDVVEHLLAFTCPRKATK